MKPKTTTESKTMLTVLLTAITGIAGSTYKPLGDFLSANAPHIIVLLAFVFGVLRKVTKKPLIWLPALAVCFLSLNSCTAVDVKVDRSQRKASTATHDIYPSKAVTPEINSEYVQKLVEQDIIRKANEAIREATK